MMSMIIKAGQIITNSSRNETLRGHAVVVKNGRISGIVPEKNIHVTGADEIVDASGCVLIPGFIQTHIHLCQTLFRGLADDLELLDWLRKKIFPFEAAHDDCSMYASAMIGIAELIRSGTTTILDMGSIGFEEEIIRAIGETGLRAFVGKAMMDVNDAYPKLKEPTKESLRSTRDLAERWHDSYDGRIKYAAAPRFVLSCTETLMKGAYEMVSDSDGMLYHTHASESKGEVQAVRERWKMENIEFLHSIGVLSRKSCLAHCIHLNENEMQILQDTQSNVTHCPSSNLKLGSGIAKIPSLLQRGINVSLGADGAPCNNNLNMFQEMRLTALLQKPIHGPTIISPKTVFEMATIGGAKALGLEEEIGSIEIGKKADIVLLNLQRLWNPIDDRGDLYSSIVYSCEPENVDSVMVEGKWLYQKKVFTGMEEQEVMRHAKKELNQLLTRIS